MLSQTHSKTIEKATNNKTPLIILRDGGSLASNVYPYHYRGNACVCCFLNGFAAQQCKEKQEFPR